MPVNSRYNFLNSDAQLGEGAFAAGNALWGGPAPDPTPIPTPAPRATPYIPSGITPDVVQAVKMGRAQQAPAPMPTPVQQPTVRRAPVPAQKPDVRGMQFPSVNTDMSVYDMPARPEYESQPMREPAELGGLGSWQSLPLSDVSGPSMGEQAPQDFSTGSVSSMGEMAKIPQPEPTPERPDLSAYEQTTLGKKALERGFDPRQLLVALAEFSAGMGNIKGQPMKSDARSFYQMQLKGEQEQRENDMKLEEMAQRFAPKPAAPMDPLKQELLKAQTDSLRNKLKTDQEMTDPNSTRSIAWRTAMESYMRHMTGNPKFKALPDLTGADVKSWMQSLQFGIGQSNIQDRAAAEAAAASTARQDRLDMEAQRIAAAQDLARQRLELDRQRLAQDKATKEAAQRGRDAALAARTAAPGKQPAGTGFKQSADLRKEYQNNPTTKATRDLMTQWGKVKEVMENPSAAGDMAGIFMFMKTLDPGSTVREGEYKSAAEATSALGRVQTALANARSGDKLNPAQRADFRNVMEKFYRAQLKQQARINADYRALAEKYGISPQDLMFVGEEKANIRSINDLPDVR